LSISVDAGSDDDLVTVSAIQYVNDGSQPVVTLGDGQDTLVIGGVASQPTTKFPDGKFHPDPSYSIAAVQITDFGAGSSGDMLNLDAVVQQLQNWDQTNSWGEAGYLRLVQDGDETLVQFDRDGAAGNAANFATIVRLQNVDAATLTNDNISLDG